MPPPTKSTENPNPEIRLREQDFELIEAAGKWSRILSVVLTILFFLTIFSGSVILLMINQSNETMPRSSASSSGFQILKSQHLDVGTGFFILSLYACFFWGGLLYLLFRFSGATRAVNLHRQATDLTKALMQLNWIFKWLVIGLLGGLGLFVLTAL